MKRIFVTLATIVFAFFTLAGIAQARGSSLDFLPDFIKELSFKFTGGYGSTAVGDFHTFIEDMNDRFDEIAEIVGLDKEGELRKLGGGFEFEGELIAKLTENFGIGLGIGYIGRSKESEMNIRYEPFGNVFMTLEPKITAIPLNLSGYYFHSFNSSLSVYLNGGFGLYFGKTTYTYEYDASAGILERTARQETEGEVKDTSLGFRGGIGLEYKIRPNIALFAEGMGRYCKFKSWEGEETIKGSYGFYQYTERNSGTLWFFEEYASDLGGWYAMYEVSEDKPSGSDVRKVRKFEGDLSGFSLRVGVRIRF